jgi:hypothetical protein
VVADSIPKEIETIPPDSPVYNVKYVHIYDSTPDTVYTGYTPGYQGSYVYGDTVVYGTGYAYPAWTGAYYFPWPITWGFAPIYDPYYGGWGFGWGFGAGFVTGIGWGIGWGWGSCCGWGWGWGGGGGGGGWGGWGYAGGWHAGWWGPYGHPYGYAHGHPYGHPYSSHYGNMTRPINTSHSATNSRGSGMGPAARQNLYNHGNNATRNAGASREAKPGQNLRGTGTGTPSKGLRSAQGQSARQLERTSPRGSNNVFAGRDGSVYRRTDKGWQQRTQGGWSRAGASPQTRQNFTQTRPNLERDFSARQRGYQRSTDFSRATGGYGGYRGGSPGGMGGGGSRGNGGSGHMGGGGARR